MADEVEKFKAEAKKQSGNDKQLLAEPVRKLPNAPTKGEKNGSQLVSNVLATIAINDGKPEKFWPEFIISWTIADIAIITKNGPTAWRKEKTAVRKTSFSVLRQAATTKIPARINASPGLNALIE